MDLSRNSIGEAAGFRCRPSNLLSGAKPEDQADRPGSPGRRGHLVVKQRTRSFQLGPRRRGSDGP